MGLLQENPPLKIDFLFTSYYSYFDRLTAACDDVANCLGSGAAVLDKYGYIEGEFPADLLIMVVFCAAAQVYSYLGVRKKMRKQPAY